MPCRPAPNDISSTTVSSCNKPQLEFIQGYGLFFISMKIIFELNPFAFRLSKVDGYGLSFLGFGINRHYRAIGFNFYTNKKPDCIDIMLVVYFYGLIKRFVIKTKRHDHFICNICGNPVWKHNLYCQNCQDEMMEDEVTWVSLK